MYSLHKLPGLSTILDLKAQYLESLTAPMDGMWDTGFVNASPHWEIQLVGARVGILCAECGRFIGCSSMSCRLWQNKGKDYI